ncbi:hypothetical protein A4X13_0g8885 [Tilletia indica]|uniref:Uncharacterized protein n=1 Tax=Tilletia indica TaxID=43049 RepID=A0A177TN57_9BASI|nr:hypothetical protein A4X13_0g8885 [Tilletia indica]
MRRGGIKNDREHLVKQYPWFEMFHEMMRDRASSDPAMLVTGKGEVNLVPSDIDEDDDDTESGNSSSNSNIDELMGDDGPDGLNLLTQAALRAEPRRINASLDRDENSQDDTFSSAEDDDEDDTRDKVDDHTATPRASASSKRSYASESTKDYIGDRGSLPTLGSLADAAKDDPMSSGARTSTRQASPGPSHQDKGKQAARSTSGGSSPTKRSATTSSHTTRAAGKGKASESAVDELNRIYQENRQRADIEKHQAKRLKYEVRAKEIDYKTQDKGAHRDFKVDLIERQMMALQTRIESIHMMTSNNTNILASINAHLGLISRHGDNVSSFRAPASPVPHWTSSSSSSSSSYAPSLPYPPTTSTAQATTSTMGMAYPMASSFLPPDSAYPNEM